MGILRIVGVAIFVLLALVCFGGAGRNSADGGGKVVGIVIGVIFLLFAVLFVRAGRKGPRIVRVSSQEQGAQGQGETTPVKERCPGTAMFGLGSGGVAACPVCHQMLPTMGGNIMIMHDRLRT
jgi:hypothetical protein